MPSINSGRINCSGMFIYLCLCRYYLWLHLPSQKSLILGRCSYTEVFHLRLPLLLQSKTMHPVMLSFQARSCITLRSAKAWHMAGLPPEKDCWKYLHSRLLSSCFHRTCRKCHSLAIWTVLIGLRHVFVSRSAPSVSNRHVATFSPSELGLRTRPKWNSCILHM